MKIKWIRHKETVDKLAGRLGLVIAGRSRGKDSDFNDFVELDIKAAKLTGSQLKRLNEEFSGFIRDTSTVPFNPTEKRDLEAEIDELSRRVGELETIDKRG